ncbi:hypothetical protein JCM9140_1894 [Halalkalibacter wakoensis JCM 9140]|uniref:Uncharacterized protein n=1 Tax=Halalkalibacter wakoensis JCM 9140 TaxID=1236970 RepID=W4Q2B7_9BACI|nr:hypothetical protein [Halalkalibacter wakoensis]GAE25873.1 hypothetical protein JCM9140_1894 [Halalkalibacter wakoensis JCM 9140]
MKKVASYYLLPIGFFWLLSASQFYGQDMQTILMTTVGTILMGLLVGFVVHLAMIIKKNLSK